MAQVLVLVLVIVTLVLINANGLHTDTKWQPFWNKIPHADIICIQEMHLTNTQEFAFGLYTQGYEFFYSHGTSASASVCVAIRRKLGMGVSLVGNIPGRPWTL